MTRLTARFVILLSFCLAALSSPTGQLAGGDIVPGNEPSPFNTPDDVPNPSIPLGAAYPQGVPRDEGQYGRVGVVVPSSNHNNGANDSQTMPHTRGNDGDSTTHRDGGHHHKEVSSTRREDPDYHPHHHHHDHRDDDNVLDHHHANGTDHGDHHGNGSTTADQVHVPRAGHGHHHNGLQAGSIDVDHPQADHDNNLLHAGRIGVNVRADHEHHHHHHHHSNSTADGHVSRADHRNHHNNPLHVDSIEQEINGSPVGIHIDEHHNH